MGATNFDGPIFTYGDLGGLESAPGGTSLLSDPNPDRGPSVLFQGVGFPDPRFTFLKDLVQGYAGRVPAILLSSYTTSVNAIPALHATNSLVTSRHTTLGTALPLVTTAAYGITPLMPIVPFTGYLNGAAPVTTGVALDWGFCYGTTTTGATAKTVTVLDSTLFFPGMPIIIAAAGAASGNVHLYTWVTALPTSTTITINDAALQAGSFAIGTGNLWSPSEFGQLTPTAAFPFLAGGPGLFLDPRQALARGIVTTVSGGASSSNHIVIAGYDVYHQAMSESIPCTSATNYGKKAFKYVVSATPDFTDGSNNYTVGTSDVFGINLRCDALEDTLTYWAGALSAGANYGITVADITNPATPSTGDVRGTIQTSAIGGGTGLGSTASNGSVSTITISGNRLCVRSHLSTYDQLQARLTHPEFGFGVVQA